MLLLDRLGFNLPVIGKRAGHSQGVFEPLPKSVQVRLASITKHGNYLNRKTTFKRDSNITPNGINMIVIFPGFFC